MPYYEPWHFMVLLLVLLPLERLIPLRHDQPVLRRRFLDDLVYFIVNPLPIMIIMAGAVSLLPAPLKALLPAAVPHAIGGLPLWLQVPLALVVAEFGFYAVHRLCHTVPFLWRIHAVHHSIADLDWLAAHRAHPLDVASTNLASLLPLLVLGFSVEAIAIWGASYFVQAHLIHSNVRLRLGPLEHVFASPHYHHWHHARDARPANFGAQLVFLDQLFGTLLRPGHAPACYGIPDPVPAFYPVALVSPFTRAHTLEPVK
ncbi:sterol desaturase family protein [Sandarakinorhabdus rubra]|uniref:sterol desaturase family protein n=1 Tax=Sandarakinorhabdus rubra TaxID=2672568 RepID=UPI0013DC2773|nr:sterol desaturase family protein [Sandarakinorhabdus rubra]